MIFLLKEYKFDFQKIRFYVGIIGGIILVMGLIYMNLDKENKEINDFSDKFLKLMYQERYIEASKYVDTSKISIDDLKVVSNLASHYLLGATFAGKNSETIYIIGFKSLTIDSDTSNDESLEFWITRLKGKLKVININSSLGHPLVK